ncbi:LysE/ArgO family amino acid transporter [Thalassomonas haliotis]|uniref:Amino acid transporter n=1 Tax=Thalassomonas haliotis TaxID=485448 RepID=A0ABY7VI65_9GAMM|nr:LysE/ArgO family amino acid transporter [Thalassomonas haliotis]WDE13424.1 amino acid transporter [Thalassomonas haliotis]
MTILPFIQGFGLGASMIIPIGAQNSFIINQGIKRNHHLIAATICIICDISLFMLGVFGGGELIGANDLLFTLISWGGILFLLGYGALSLKAAIRASTTVNQQDGELQSFKGVILTTLAVTLLNPHVYLDTVVILGSVSSQFSAAEKPWYLFGLVLASILWFYGLSVFAAKFSPVLGRKKVKQGIDIAIAVIMWLIAWSLFNNWLASA